MDVSPGASQEAVKADFPNGLPAVSDASQSQFMEPYTSSSQSQHNVTGVPVTLTDIDPTATTRQSAQPPATLTGAYGITWTPPIAGNYTITATFAGQELLWIIRYNIPIRRRSSSNTPTNSDTSKPNQSATTSILGIAAIVVIIIIGAVLALLHAKKTTIKHSTNKKSTFPFFSFKKQWRKEGLRRLWIKFTKVQSE